MFDITLSTVTSSSSFENSFLHVGKIDMALVTCCFCGDDGLLRTRTPPFEVSILEVLQMLSNY